MAGHFHSREVARIEADDIQRRSRHRHVPLQHFVLQGAEHLTQFREIQSVDCTAARLRTTDSEVVRVAPEHKHRVVLPAMADFHE